MTAKDKFWTTLAQYVGLKSVRPKDDNIRDLMMLLNNCNIPDNGIIGNPPTQLFQTRYVAWEKGHLTLKGDAGTPGASGVFKAKVQGQDKDTLLSAFFGRAFPSQINMACAWMLYKSMSVAELDALCIYFCNGDKKAGKALSKGFRGVGEFLQHVVDWDAAPKATIKIAADMDLSKYTVKMNLEREPATKAASSRPAAPSADVIAKASAAREKAGSKGQA